MQAATGATVWHHELGDGATVLNLTAAGGAGVAECGREIRCLEAADGRERWRFAISDLPRFAWTTSVVAGEAVVCAGSVIAPAGLDVGVLACLGLADGVPWWERSISDHGFRLAARNGVVYGGTAGGRLFASEIDTDQQLWGKSFPWRQTDPPAVPSVAMTVPIVTDEWLYVGCGNGYTYRIDPAVGTAIWRWEAPLRVEAIAHTSGVIFAGFFDGSVAAYPDHCGDFLWWQRGPIGRIEGLTYANGMLYVSGKRHLAAFRAADGRPPWQWRLSTSRSVRAPTRPQTDAR
jgi:outer membrane protein assembly factor BamB